MPKVEFNRTAAIGALLAFALAPFLLLPLVSQHDAAPAQQSGAAAAAKPDSWIAVAPGRVEPRAGEIRIGAEAPGRIVEVPVVLNDTVAPGDLLARLDDAEASARLAGAAADVAARKQQREKPQAGSRADRRQKAEDAAFESEQRVYAARGAFDRALADDRAGKGEADGVGKARAVLGEAERQFMKDRAALGEIVADRDTPPVAANEAALTAARAQMSIAQVAFERTRIRAPAAGTILQVAARLGELAAPNAEQSLFVIGDVSTLRVRAEIEERDVGKIKLGQKVRVRTDAFKDADFAGTVTAVAGALAPARLGSRAGRRPADQDTLEVFATLEGKPPLISGMRVDVFFAPPPVHDEAKP